MEFTWKIIIWVFLIQLFCSFIKGLAGFGDPLISNPLYSMLMDNKVISPMNLCLQMPLNAYVSWKNRKNFSIKGSIPVAVSILCGVIPGTILLKYGTSWMLKALLGIVIIGIGIEMITRNRAKIVKENKIVLCIVSFFSGVTSGLFGINLFFVAYIERTSKNRDSFRGNICFIFLIENVFRFIVYTATGIFTKNVFYLVLIALPGMLLGFSLGTHIDKKLSDLMIRRVIISLFMLGGTSVLIKAVLSI